MKQIGPFEVADVLDDPASFFNHPDEVVSSDDLSYRDKHMVLEYWQAHALSHGGDRADAAEPAATDDAASSALLESITAALHRLQSSSGIL